MYEQSNKLDKYIGVLNQPFLYLYKDKKDLEYKDYYYLKDCEICYNKDCETFQKPFSVTIKNKVNEFTLGFDKAQTM